MHTVYREATFPDENELFILASSLATSYSLNKTDFSGIYAEIIRNPNSDIYIAEVDKIIVGYVLAFHHSTFYANGVVSWVEELFVLEKYRKLKIGRNLMRLVESKALERGSKLVALATRRASDFYKAIGYDESATYFKKPLSYENG